MKDRRKKGRRRFKSFKDILIIRNMNSRKVGDEFKRIFKVSLGSFWNPLRGFDIVKFDDHLKCPKRVSLKNFIKKEYGQRAEQIIEGLL